MSTPSALTPEQRSALLAAKLRALVSRHPSGAPEEVRGGTVPGGVTLEGGGRGWVMLDEEPERSIGVAVAWATRRGLRPEVVAEDASGALARRASYLVDPPKVWSVAGADLVAADPAPHPPMGLAPPPGTETLVELLDSLDLEVTVEEGQVVAEVLGLEVARIVPGGEDHRLEVGVGSNDREVVALVHGELAAAESLAAVVEVVRRHRAPGAQGHPLNRLVPERWLRATLAADPARLGLTDLTPLPSVEGRRGLRQTQAAAGIGHDRAGAPVVVVCSVGIDLDLVPSAADSHRWWADASGADPSEVGLRLVLPERDVVPVLEEMVASLVVPTEIVTVPDDWRR